MGILVFDEIFRYSLLDCNLLLNCFDLAPRLVYLFAKPHIMITHFGVIVNINIGIFQKNTEKGLTTANISAIIVKHHGRPYMPEWRNWQTPGT